MSCQQVAQDWKARTIENLESYLQTANVPCTIVHQIHRSAKDFSSLIVKLNDVIGTNAIITGFLSKASKDISQGKLNLAFTRKRARLLNNIGTTTVKQICLLSLKRHRNEVVGFGYTLREYDVGFDFDYYQLKCTNQDENIVLDNSDDE